MMFVGLGMLFTGATNTFFSALLWRLITGIGSGSSNVPVMGLMSAWFGTSFRGLATGIAVSGSSIALIVTGPSVPRLLSALPESGWRVTWYIFGGISLLLALLAAVYLRNEPTRSKGEVLSGSDSTDHSQIKSGTVLQWRLVYRSPIVWHLGIIYATFGFSYIIYITFFIRYLVGEIGYTRISAGNLFMLMGWFSLGCGLIWGGLSDRIGRRYALIIVYLIQILSFITFALWQKQPGLSVSAALFGLTAWSTPAIMAATCGDVVGHRLAPAALGFITLFFGIGQSLGPFVAGFIADLTGSFVGAFLLAAAVASLGVIAILFLKSANVQACE
jgi:MFS family permease